MRLWITFLRFGIRVHSAGMSDVCHEHPSIPGYVVEHRLGVGSTGTVWAAREPHTGARVAVKVVDEAHVSTVEGAWLVGQDIPDIVTIHRVLTLADGRPAVVMDLRRGGSLAAVVRARGHLSPGETVTVLTPLAQALAALHQRAVVHGDVSPGNVLFDDRGRPALADLGQAQVIGTDPRASTWGTDGFVAPEILAGELGGPATDVYSLGAIGWLCLTGSAPGHHLARGRLLDSLGGSAQTPPELVRLAELVESAVSGSPGARPAAIELAESVYAVCPPRALRLVSDPTQVGSVTERVRAAAQRDLGVVAAPAETGRHRRSVPPVADRLRAAGRRLGPSVAAALGVAVLAGVLTIVGLPPLPDLSFGASRDSAAPAAPSASPLSPIADPEAARSRPEQLVQALADERAHAWRSGSAARLLTSDASGSPALARDTAALTALSDAGATYDGVRFVVREATWVSGTPATASVRVRTDTTAYSVVRAGTRSSRPAVQGQPMLVELVWTDAGWRVHDLKEAATAT